MGKELHYFKIPPLYYFLINCGGLAIFGVVALAPDVIPYDSLSFVGSALHYLAYNYPTLLKIGFVAAIGAHIAEALYVWSVCRELNITQSDTVKWVIQTLLVGFPSTLIIRAKRRSLKQQ